MSRDDDIKRLSKQIVELQRRCDKLEKQNKNIEDIEVSQKEDKLENLKQNKNLYELVEHLQKKVNFHNGIFAILFIITIFTIGILSAKYGWFK